MAVLWMLLGTIGLAAAVLTGVYLGMLRRDIRRMADTVKAIASEETNAEVYTLTGDKKLKELAVEVNSMIRSHRAAKREMKRADEAFKRSITGISHDLRTPLTSVSGYVQMLGSDKMPPDKQREYLTIIDHRLDSLRVLLDELFDYTRLQSDREAAQPEKLNAASILLEQLALYYQEFVQRQSGPEVLVSQEAVPVFADKKNLERVFQNLIKNMLTHGTGLFRVELTMNGSEAKAVFSNSTDMVLEDPDRIFERFYTGDRSRSGKTTGLGLSIVKQLVEDMDGIVGAEQKGGILSINVSLPIKK